MKYLIVGLGNIGDEYAYTRHNIGFLVLDALAKASNTFFSQGKLAYKAEFKFKGRTFVLIKPTTYMNLSGKAVNYWLQAEKIPLENCLVIADDIALPFGTLRMKGKGSDGGHNGLKDIIYTLETVDFARLRFGIGDQYAKGSQVDYVLGKWSKEEEKTLEERINQACEMAKSFATIGLGLTMTQYNNK